MAVNVEIKAHARDVERLHALAAELANRAPEVVEQIDTFFCVPSGRLKLRELGPDRGELIHYHRRDQTGPARSAYSIVQTNEPAALRDCLAAALGVRGVVRKKRWIYHVGQTRIHVDDVSDLGSFLEVEVVLSPEQSVEDGRQIFLRLKDDLDIRDEDLIQGAYIDLLEQTAV